MNQISAESFYATLDAQERKLTFHAARDLVEFMKQHTPRFLIAATGRSIQQASKAAQIELAVAGLSCSGRTMQDAERFTHNVLNYANRTYHHSTKPVRHTPRITCEIGPFAGMDEIVSVTLHRQPAQVSTHLELFSNFHITPSGTKGVQIQYPQCRQISIHFLYNSTPDGWLEFCEKESNPYAVLHLK